MTPNPPHRTLMLLHRLVDRALTPLLAPMQLQHATEGYVTVSRGDLDGLVAAYGDPQGVLAGFGPRAISNGVLIAEPSLTSTILSRIWRSDRNAGAPLTQVEGEILRQFLARLVEAWSDSWRAEGAQLLPEFSMAGSLSMLQPQLDEGRWFVARTVVREPNSPDPVGVLLFCYPEALLPQLDNEARSTLWRARVARGLTEAERGKLRARLAGPLHDVAITAPVKVHQHMTLGMLNSLERGDIVAFEENLAGEITLDVLGRAVTAKLARSGDQLAIAVGGPGADAPPEAADMPGAAPMELGLPAYDTAGAPPPPDSWGDDLAIA
ncbi:MAG: hypothetical protein JWO69_1791 [Thermoleophilia bacterium]|jgi:hypothetical protein|nr:hypothetical protein [Thermoleophilia bacterium]